MKIVYTTTPTKKDSVEIARMLLEAKLIACANIIENESSLYWWNGQIAEEKEYVLLCKTTDKCTKKIMEVVEKNHPYTCPCIAVLDVNEVNKKYLQWLDEETESN